MKKLIIHIGTGKTGISSIRRSALDSALNLSKHNIFYLGKFFEYSPDPTAKISDCFREGAHHLRDQWRISIEKAFHQSLDDVFSGLPDDSVGFVLNESLHHLHSPFASSLKQFEERSQIQIKIKAYARNHGDYSVSAYKQWGLKHKTNTGPTLSYTAWCQKFEKHFICYGQQLKEWKEVFQDNMMIYNYDFIENIAIHFQNILRSESDNQLVALEKTTVRSNKTPGMDRLVLHALANHGVHQQSLPVNLDKLLNKHPLPSPNLDNLELMSLIPTTQDIQALSSSAAAQEDQAIVNTLLKSGNELPLSDSSLLLTDAQTPQTEHTLSNKALSNLLNILISQGQTIQKLQDDLHRLHHRLDHLETTEKPPSPNDIDKSTGSIT